MKQQLQYLLGGFLSIPLIPLIYWQGKRVRAAIPKLPEAKKLNGLVKKGGKPIQILFIGDSAIAGVGVSNNENGIAGNVARTIAETKQQTVEWKVLAKSGYTSQDAIQELLPKLSHDINYDLIIIGLGANDVFEINSPQRCLRYLSEFISSLRLQQPIAPFLITNLPPFGELPNFPKLLSFYLGQMTRLHAEIINEIPARFDNVYYLKKRITFAGWEEKLPKNYNRRDFFASDGVHPSALTYRIWGKEIAEQAMNLKLL